MGSFPNFPGEKKNETTTYMVMCFGGDKENTASNPEIQHLSHAKNPCYFPLYWLVNRDPYNGLL